MGTGGFVGFVALGLVMVYLLSGLD